MCPLVTDGARALDHEIGFMLVDAAGMHSLAYLMGLHQTQ